MSTTQKTLADVLSGVALTMSVRRATRNPLMQDADGMDHWYCMLKCGDNKMNVYFSKGRGHHGARPTLEEVLDCLASDSSTVANSPTFEDWASELGCDPDSRKAEKIWKVCTNQAIRLEYLLGPSLYKALLLGDRATMSLPDHELDEPSDTEWCFIHEDYRPCWGCRVEDVNRRLDERKEQ